MDRRALLEQLASLDEMVTLEMRDRKEISDGQASKAKPDHEELRVSQE